MKIFSLLIIDQQSGVYGDGGGGECAREQECPVGLMPLPLV